MDLGFHLGVEGIFVWMKCTSRLVVECRQLEFFFKAKILSKPYMCCCFQRKELNISENEEPPMDTSTSSAAVIRRKKRCR